MQVVAVNYSEALIGQKLVQSSAFPSGTTITNISGTTITVSDNASASTTSALARISPAADSFYIASGSLTVPANNEFRFTNITGSDDANYQSGTRTYGMIFPLASTSSTSNAIAGDFAQLKISKFGSRVSNVEASFYITASSDGVNGIPTGKTQLDTNTTYAVVEQSVSESMAPIFAASDVSISTGYSLAGYQTAVDTVFDTFATGSGAATGGTGSFSGSFTGSFKGDITASKVSASLTDGNGITDFTYDGSAPKSVSVQVSGSTLDVGTSGLRVADQGITSFQISSSAVTSSGALFGGGGTKLGVQVDGNTIEISGGSLSVVTGGLPTSSLATSSFTLGSTVVKLGDTKTTLNKLNLTAVTASGEFSGSASGSFQGDGSGLTGIASTLMYTASLGSGSGKFKITSIKYISR